MQSWIFSIINKSIILICWFGAQEMSSYQCWKQLCCLIFVWKLFCDFLISRKFKRVALIWNIIVVTSNFWTVVSIEAWYDSMPNTAAWSLPSKLFLSNLWHHCFRYSEQILLGITVCTLSWIQPCHARSGAAALLGWNLWSVRHLVRHPAEQLAMLWTLSHWI